MTMPTRMYSRGEFIAQPSFLQMFTGFGEADEGHKRDNGYDNNKQIKHGVPPHWAVDSQCPQLLQFH